MPSSCDGSPRTLHHARTGATARRRRGRLAVAADLDTRLIALARASDFAIETLLRQPDLLLRLAADPDARATAAAGAARRRTATDWPALLRRYRAAESTRLIWRDVLGLDDVDDTLAGSTRLAEACLQLGAGRAGSRVRAAPRRGARPRRQRAAAGGVRPGQARRRRAELQLRRRPGLRLRARRRVRRRARARGRGTTSRASASSWPSCSTKSPPTASAIASTCACVRTATPAAWRWSFAAMEQYFQREGRDWERYAWQKARPVAGDIDGRRALPRERCARSSIAATSTTARSTACAR